MSFSQEDVDAVLGVIEETYADGLTVRRVQEALNRRGEKLQVDGILGPRTRAALRRLNDAVSRPGPLNDSVTDRTLLALAISRPGKPGTSLVVDVPAVPSAKSGAAGRIALASAAVPTCGADGMEGWWYLVAVLCVIMGMALFFGMLGQDKRRQK